MFKLKTMKKFYTLFFLICSITLCAYGTKDDLNAKRRPENFTEKENIPEPNEPMPDKVDALDSKHEDSPSSFWPGVDGSSKPDIKEADSKTDRKKEKRSN